MAPSVGADFRRWGTVETAAVYVRAAQPRRPCLVVLLGWMGSSWRYLQKVAELYDAQAYDVVAVTPTLLSTVSTWQSDRFALKIRMVLEEVMHTNTSTTVFVHALSNGGGLVAARLLPLLEGHASLRVKGVILDSLPARLQEFGALRAFCLAAASGLPTAGLVGRLIHTVAELLITALACVLWALSRVNLIFTEYEYQVRLAICHARTPRLLLFGEKDTLVPPAHVYYFASMAFMPITKVVKKSFPEGQHVRLHARYPAEYAAAVKAFLVEAQVETDSMTW